MDSRTKALEAAQAALDKKAKDTVILELKDLTIIADYFVICSGESTTQVKAIVENIDKRLKDHRQRPSGVEGLNSARWVLMDYGDVIVHVFEEDTRAYYELEKFWLDAPKIAVEDKAVKTAAGSKKQYV
ncbi:MAG: ribosome silencing factor [Nitrospirae bacterium]|nr:ribosome silencing factor [Nitrospirota bacterium]MCL5978259.1 ribosome silencing factor [Nitrospirota bacterium]